MSISLGASLKNEDFLRTCYSENGHFALEMGLGKSFLWAKKMHNPTGHNSHSLPKIISLSPVGTRLSHQLPPLLFFKCFTAITNLILRNSANSIPFTLFSLYFLCIYLIFKLKFYLFLIFSIQDQDFCYLFSFTEIEIILARF